MYAKITQPLIWLEVEEEDNNASNNVFFMMTVLLAFLIKIRISLELFTCNTYF